jgi:hypothetical protein
MLNVFCGDCFQELISKKIGSETLSFFIAVGAKSYDRD